MGKQKEIDIRAEVRGHIAKTYKTQRAAAAAWGLSETHVSLVLKGERMMPDVMANDAGYELVQAKAQWVRCKK